MKTSPENITLFHLLCFAIISTRSTFAKMAHYPGTKLVGVASVQVKKENEKFAVVRRRSPQNLKCGHFTLLFCRGRQRNVPKCKTHVQSDCFCSLNLLFCSVVVSVASSLLKLPNVTSNSPSQDYTHPNDHNLRTYIFLLLK